MILTFLILPMLIVLPVSFTDRSFVALPEASLSLRHYQAFFTNRIWLDSTLQSVVIAAASSFASVILGTLCAIGCWRVSNRYSNLVRLLMLAPLIVPTVVQGLAMYRLWVGIGLFDTAAGVILAHTLTGIPYVVITVSTSLAAFDVKLEQAARSLGASAFDTIRLVIVPAITPGLLSGGVFSFVHSFDELVIVLFLTSRSVQTLPKKVWDGIQDRLDPTVASLSVIFIAITFCALLASRMLQQRRAVRMTPSG